jgi:hypothetical protein
MAYENAIADKLRDFEQTEKERARLSQQFAQQTLIER